jgi:hypothetical protein
MIIMIEESRRFKPIEIWPRPDYANMMSEEIERRNKIIKDFAKSMLPVVDGMISDVKAISDSEKSEKKDGNERCPAARRAWCLVDGHSAPSAYVDRAGRFLRCVCGHDSAKSIRLRDGKEEKLWVIRVVHATGIFS